MAWFAEYEPTAADPFRLIVPTPLLLAPIAAVAFWHIFRGTSRRRQPGHCPACGYNLTGDTSGICPECGDSVDQSTVQKCRLTSNVEFGHDGATRV